MTTENQPKLLDQVRMSGRYLPPCTERGNDHDLHPRHESGRTRCVQPAGPTGLKSPDSATKGCIASAAFLLAKPISRVMAGAQAGRFNL